MTSERSGSESSDVGFIYCLYNPAFVPAYGKNVYKFGLARDPGSRIHGYTTPYVEPSHFVCVSECVYDCKRAESMLFKRLRYSRLKDNREFFWCRPDLIEGLFAEIVATINNGKDIKAPTTNVSASHLGTVPHLRAFISDEFTTVDGEKLSGESIETMYASWCIRRNCKPLDSLREHANDIETHLGFKTVVNNERWWVYDLKPQSKEPLISEYISQNWKVIPINEERVFTKWTMVCDHFRGWYQTYVPDSDIPFKLVWECLQTRQLKCHWPVGALENVSAALLRSTTLKLIKEIEYVELQRWVDTGNNIDIVGLQLVLTSNQSLDVYLKESTEENRVYIVHLDLLYTKYINWCVFRDHTPLDKKLFVKILEEKEYTVHKSVYIKGIKLKGEEDQSDFVSEYISQNCKIGKTFKCRFNILKSEYNKWNESRNRLGCDSSHLTEILSYLGYETIKSGTVKWTEGLVVTSRVNDIIIPLRTYIRTKRKKASTVEQLQKDLGVKGCTKYKLSLLLVCSDNTIVTYPNINELEH